MLRSAYRLLNAEADSSAVPEVPSRHRTSTGQDLRAAWFRLVLTDSAASRLAETKAEAEAELRVLFHRECLVALLRSVEERGEKWVDPFVPDALSLVDWSWNVVVVKVPAPVAAVRPQSLAELREAMSRAGAAPARLDVVDDKGKTRVDGALLADSEGGAAFLRILDREKGTVVRCETVAAEAGNEEARLGADVRALREKRVGVVGLGSAGSKIAFMLARSGVRKFVLVDDDLFLPENMVRHTLDWRSVGEHKVDGVGFQLELVSPDVEVNVERRRLTGQESTTSVARALSGLASCDLVVDATACGRTFGLLGTMASRSNTALVWLEVFEGGIGGLVGRYRPGLDPDPFVIRARIAGYLEEQRAPELQSAGPYATERENGEPLVASDADVTLVSSHAARFALDILGDCVPSEFPHSVYLVGLLRAWLFEAPFHTIPIDVGEPEVTGEHGKPGGPPSEETARFIVDVLERGSGGRDTSSS